MLNGKKKTAGKRCAKFRERNNYLTTDAVFLAMGFTGAEQSAWLNELGVEFTERGNIEVNNSKQTNVQNVFAAGDCERGQSLIVWAIKDGRDAAKGVHDFLTEEN